MKVFSALIICVLFALGINFAGAQEATGSQEAAGIASTKHNLTRFGPGSVKARSQIREELCIFCHTAHGTKRNQETARFFGWNRADSTATYTTYDSSTMFATVGQPTGASKLCLSCHDGTIALGSILSQRNPIPFQGDWENSPANLGTHLADDHPISFTYDSELAIEKGELVDPKNLPQELRLDPQKQLQCTTCHDAHDDSNGKFLRVPNQKSEICEACHTPSGWEANPHAVSEASWNGEGDDPWPEDDAFGEVQIVADYGCGNCHKPHNALGEKRLLRFEQEEANCLNCHNGNVATKDIANETLKPYAHRPQDYIAVHDTAERFSSDQPEEKPKHVECSDCHNPHQLESAVADAPFVSGPTRGVSGMDIAGDAVDEAQYGYEICFKCHASNDSTQQIRIARQVSQLNTRLEFQEENPSSHPLVAPRFNYNVPSLLPEYSPESIIRCTDCHGNDRNTKDGGEGPNGPHGSDFEFLLVRNYQTQDFTTESYDAYALCYGCHNRESILGDESFAEHDSHVRGNDTPCSVCHDPHGISETQGDARNHQYLINFDINVVSPNSLGDLYWEEGIQGPGSSRCSLACHGVDHNNTEDRPIGFDPTNGLSGSPNSWPFSGAFPD